MKILALETTAVAGSVAAIDGDNPLLELELDNKQRSAQSLAPAMVRLLGRLGWQPQDIALVAVTVGPGSFTGLRVGVTTAKTFAYAAGAEVLGIDTLETIAAGVSEACLRKFPLPLPNENREEEESPPDFLHFTLLHAALDAQRGEVVTQSFLRSPDGAFRPQGEQKLLPAARWLKELAPGSVITGPVLGRLRTQIPPRLVVLPELLWHPRARHVGRLAARDYAAGRREDLWRLAPRYSRRSAAEEKRDVPPSAADRSPHSGRR